MATASSAWRLGTKLNLIISNGHSEHLFGISNALLIMLNVKLLPKWVFEHFLTINLMYDKFKVTNKLNLPA